MTIKKAMARPPRLQYPGALYHITARGNERKAIFRSDEDRQRFLAILAKIIERHHLVLHAYVLMDNHYHLLLATPEANLALALRPHLCGSPLGPAVFLAVLVLTSGARYSILLLSDAV